MPIITASELFTTELDYLFVGGGTAGLAAAVRLSENPNVTVGVIEAGDHHVGVPDIEVPGMMGRAIANPKYDWTLFSVPQHHAKDRVFLQPRGKGLGGSSLINFLGMFRATKDEYDALELMGNKGWNWDSFLKYMKKSETTIPSGLSVDDAKKYAVGPIPEFHGTEGPVIKAFPSYTTELHAILFDTAGALGVKRNEEPNGGNPIGAMSSYTSVDSRIGRRSDAATAYYEPNADRKNLYVLTNAQVTKILFESDKTLQRAIGVEFVYEGQTHSVRGVKREIILSAGTFQTPQILELSGIGNPAILAKYGIENVVNLPGVGENLQDHVAVPTVVEVDNKFDTIDVLVDPERAPQQQKLYDEEKRGFLSSPPAHGFLFLPAQDFGTDDDIKLWQARANECAAVNFTNIPPDLKAGFQKQYDIQKEWFKDKSQPQAEILNFLGHYPHPTVHPVPGKRYNTLLCALLHPLSRGTCHIASPDPLAPPAINPNYFGNEVDFEVLVHLVKYILRLHATQPLAGTIKNYILPPPDVLKGNEAEKDVNLREYVKDAVTHLFHPVGTASMLPRSEGGVVDSELKVYGTSNLRIADLSILPLELATHLQATAFAIGEKAADILKATHSE